MRRSLIVVLLFAPFFAAAEAAELAEVKWLHAVIRYDKATWHVVRSPQPNSLIFRCLAADCRGKGNIYAHAFRTGGDPGGSCSVEDPRDPSGGQPEPVAGTAIPFSILSRWSGCRALDLPIVEACGEHNGITYQLEIMAGGGCNFAPGLSAERFTELLKGVQPVAEPPR